MTLHDDLGDLRAAFDDVLTPDGRLVTEAGASHVLLREGRRRVRRRRVLTASGAVAAVASVAVIVTATALIGQSHTGSRPTPALTKPAQSPLQGVVLGIDHSNRLVLEDLARPAEKRFLTISGIGAFATNPAGGWIASYVPAGRKGPTYVGLIDLAGKFTPTKQLLAESGQISDLAVSPDGSRLAFVAGNVGTATVTRLVVGPAPGHSGSTNTWTLQDRFINQISSLSWAPDGRELTYVTGVQTGAGLGGTVGTLDTTVPGQAVPTHALFDDKACADEAVGWLGTTGRLTVVRECKAPNAPSGPHLVDIDPTSEAGLGAGTPLQGHGCAETSLSASQDGSRVLVSQCGSVSLVMGGHRIAVPGNLLDAAWAGTGLPTPGTVMGASGKRCPPADFTLPTPDASWGLTSTGADYRTLPVGGSVVVATGPGGRTITLVRGVDQNDFAVSVYSHGPKALVPLNVLRSQTDVYPAEVTGAGGPRVPFTTGADPISSPCDRWELQTTDVSIPTLVVYAQTIEPIASPTSATCSETALVLRTSYDGWGPDHAMVFVLTNQSKTACTISGYPRVSLLDMDTNPVPVKTDNGSGGSYQDPGPRSITIAPSGHTSFGVSVRIDVSKKCDSRSLMRVTLPGQTSFTLPSSVPPCQASEMTVTALVAGSLGPPRS